MNRLSWGIKTTQQHTTYDALLKVWQEADRAPAFEHAWLYDHFAPIQGSLDGPCFEGWTLLAALAAQTRRLRLGVMVTGNGYRHPAVLAHMAATVDVISNGRLDFGIGAGWTEYEHASMGIPLPPPGERIRRLDEACEIARRLFTQPRVDFAGRYYQLKEARLEPKPIQRPHPPFVIGGAGERLTLRTVARHADVWNYTASAAAVGDRRGPDADAFQHKVRILHDHCRSVGRDPARITLSVQIAVDYDDLGATVVQLRPLVDAGATHLVLMLSHPYPDDIVSRLVDEVVARLA